MTTIYQKTIVAAGISALMLTSTYSLADNHKENSAKGLNVVITTDAREAQMMGLVLSFQTLKAHQKKVNITFCGPAGDLTLKSTKTAKLKPRDVSPTMLLNKVISMGANVEICPLYLPNANKTKSDLIKGISVAKPPVVAGRLLNQNYQNLSY